MKNEGLKLPLGRDGVMCKFVLETRLGTWFNREVGGEPLFQSYVQPALGLEKGPSQHPLLP